jgi:hypothetical protein
MTIARNIELHVAIELNTYIFSILKFFVKTGTSLANMEKRDSNFRSHSVYWVSQN